MYLRSSVGEQEQRDDDREHDDVVGEGGPGALERGLERRAAAAVRAQVGPGEVEAADAEAERGADRDADQRVDEAELHRLAQPTPAAAVLRAEPEHPLL